MNLEKATKAMWASSLGKGFGKDFGKSLSLEKVTKILLGKGVCTPWKRCLYIADATLNFP